MTILLFLCMAKVPIQTCNIMPFRHPQPRTLSRTHRSPSPTARRSYQAQRSYLPTVHQSQGINRRIKCQVTQTRHKIQCIARATVLNQCLLLYCWKLQCVFFKHHQQWKQQHHRHPQHHRSRVNVTCSHSAISSTMRTIVMIIRNTFPTAHHPHQIKPSQAGPSS